MTAERPPIAADPAIRRPLGDIAAGGDRFTQARVERILQLVVGLGAAVLAAQAFLTAVGSVQEQRMWHLALMITAFVPIALMVVSLLTGVLVRVTSTVCVVALFAVYSAWPIATAGVATPPDSPAWVWYLLNVTTAAAAMVAPLAAQIAVAVSIPTLYLVGRLLQLGTAFPVVVPVVLEAVFAMILGGVIIALGWTLRSVAVEIDRARAAAVSSYAAAAEADAAETERVAVAALMHDSVLAALISAERAATPREDALAAAMAREALTRLANAEQDPGEGSDEPVTPAALVGAIESSAAPFVAGLRVASAARGDAAPIPGRVARAIVLAATQAVANSVQHAGGRGLSVELGTGSRRVIVRIVDTGDGFSPDEVDDDRLGIRGSIVARMAAAGGRARVHTSDAGTQVVLEWERPR
ncbi:MULTISPECIES: ATP-binding protein [unclassified Microbacterium]|uniref:ATP-binding protein n=1 Tax=unclassified Microbacterium TaxID=2609290 RepID=UPI000AD74B58|nr:MULTISPECIES: ATP-binding protein [unclassified Microbacterium]MBN9223163.1 ATP-binding protein [Microbacterium sp.]